MIWTLNLVAAVLLANGAGADAIGAPMPAADGLWGRMQEMRTMRTDAGQEEWRALKFRELGLQFYRQYPHDRRRWEWLYETVVSIPPRYSAGDADVQHQKQLNWQDLFDRELEPALMATVHLTVQQRVDICARELSARLLYAEDRHGRGEQIEFGGIMQAIMTFGERFPSADDAAGSLLGQFFYYAESWPVDQQAFARGLTESSNRKMAQLGASRHRLLESRGQRLDLELTSIDGQNVDLSSLHNRVVLLEFWSLACSSCISGMQRIKPVYERYVDQGFTVLGMAFEDIERAQEVTARMKQINVVWPQVLLGSPKRSPLWERYGFTGLPAYFLLDRQGRLVTTNINHASGPRLEQEVRRLLGLPAQM